MENSLIKGRFGVIIPASNTTLEDEFRYAVPDGYYYHISRIITKDVTVEGLRGFKDGIKRAGEEVNEAKVKLVVVACTSGTFIDGSITNDFIIKELHAVTKCPILTTSTAVIETLHSLNARKISMATPYIEEVSQRESSFLREHGIKTVSVKNLGIEAKGTICKVPNDKVLELAKGAYKKGVDALFLSCTNMPTLGVIDELQKVIQCPVFSSNSATLFRALVRLGWDGSLNQAWSTTAID